MSVFDGTAQPGDRMSEYQRVASEGGLSLKRKAKRLAALTEVLYSGEPVLALTTGTQEGHLRESLIALTDRRILILKNDPREAVSLDLARVVRVAATQGANLGQLEIELQDMKWAISLAHSRSVTLFARRAEAARLERADPRQVSTAQLHYQDVTPVTPIQPPHQAPVTALPAFEHPPGSLAQPVAPEVRQIPAGRSVADATRHPSLPSVGEVIDPGEQVTFSTTASDTALAAFVALTDRRVLAVATTVSGDTQTMATDLEQIRSISGHAGENFGTIQIDDGTQTWSIPLIQNDMVEPFINRVQEAIEARRPPTPPPAQGAAHDAAAGVNIADELEKLAALMERGLLTPEEFAAQKAKLLG